MTGIVSLIVGSFDVKRGVTLSPVIPMTLYQRRSRLDRWIATAKEIVRKWQVEGGGGKGRKGVKTSSAVRDSRAI